MKEEGGSSDFTVITCFKYGAAIDFLSLKALTDHFGGGSRVVSFDPYS